MMKLSLAAEVLAARRTGAEVEFNAVATDSRQINQGDLFVALVGEHFDGARFVAEVAAKGAVAAMINAESYTSVVAAIDPAFPLLLVDDTRLALGKLAAHWRDRFSLPLAAITGSNGKTTVKEMLASILRQQTANAESVLATKGNLNNDLGMPLTLLKLTAAHRYAVIEMGMNHPGEIDYLTHLAHPDVAVITNAGCAHLAGLGTVAAVAQAKGEIFAGLSAQGCAVINADDDHAALWKGLAGERKVLTFGIEHAADVQASWQAQGFGSRVEICTAQEKLLIDLQVPGAHNVSNALAATAAALALHIPAAAIVAGLNAFTGVAGRLQAKSARHGARLIDDTYNANPASLHAALAVLARASGQTILVLGDMGELGSEAAHFHAEIGAEARQLGIQKLLALGDLSSYAVDEFGVGAEHFKRIEDLLARLETLLNADSSVLVKGSRFMKMERVVQYCTALQ
jgi:UDP-N-acetylmuramoyl-tripeptide--D-alanyl-D-alanine ligase